MNPLETLAPNFSTYEERHYYGNEGRKRMVEAAKFIATIVGTTLGPKGMPAMLDREDKAPTITKDGITVLYDLEFTDRVYSIVYETIRAASETVSKTVGDGTTTVVMLTAALMQEIHKLQVAGIDYRKIETGVRRVAKHICDQLIDNVMDARDESSIRAVLKTASNNDTRVVDTLTEVFLEVGDEGMIFIREGTAIHDQVIYEQGFDLPIKLKTPEILDPKTLRCTMDNPYILVGYNHIKSAARLINILEDLLNRGETKDIVIIYSEMSDDALSLIHKNNHEKNLGLRIAAFRMPLYAERQKEYLEDLAAITDATMVDHALGIKYSSLGLEQCGRAKWVELYDSLFRLTGGRGYETVESNGKTRAANRLEEVKQFRDLFTGNQQERTRQNERVAKLTGAVVAVCPGGINRSEVMHRRGVYEDALMAGQSALKGGVIAGGGWPWMFLTEGLTADDYEEQAGITAACNAFQSIFHKLAKDAGVTTRHIKEAITAIEGNPLHIAFDIREMKAGLAKDLQLLDSVEMHLEVIDQAISTALTLMSTEVIITNVPTQEYLEWKERMRNQHIRA